MKRLMFPALAALAFLITTPAMGADGAKIASVDVRKVALESKGGVEATKLLSDLAEKLGGKLKAKQTELEKIKGLLEGKGKQLSPKERAAKEKEIQKKLSQYREMAEKAQKDLQKKEEEIGGKVMTGIEKAVNEYAQKNGYTLVIRKGDVVYKNEKQEITDITDAILKLVDATPVVEKK